MTSTFAHPTPARPERTAYSIREFCQMNGVGRSTVYRWEEMGIVHLSRSGGRAFLTNEDIAAWKAGMAA
jgi:predicted site-specific integrase-resolvase